MKTNVISTLEVAESYIQRIQEAKSDEERQRFATEWHQAYAAFSPEEKAEVQPLLDRIKESIQAHFDEIDALIEDFKKRRPNLAHIFEGN
jgi:hemerythrin